MAFYYGDDQDKARKIVVAGIPGPQGETGPQGPAGVGVPDGGTDGQILVIGTDGPKWAKFFQNSSGVGVDYETAYGYLRGPWMIADARVTGNFEVIDGGYAEVKMPESSRENQITNKKYVDDKIQASTEDLEAGVSPLETGKLYVVYE